MANAVTDYIASEPVAIAAAVAAIVSLIVGFGVSWSTEQVALVNAAVVAVLALFVRHAVSPKA